MRRVVKTGALLLVIAIGLFATAGLAGGLWLHSRRGHDFVRREIEDKLGEQIRGTLFVERLEGGLLHSVTLKRIEIRDVRGRKIARTDSARASYSFWQLVVGRPRIQRMDVRGLDLDVPVLLHARLGPGKTKQADVAIADIVVHDGRIRFGRLIAPIEQVESLEGRLGVWIGNQSALFVVRKLTGRVPLAGGAPLPLHASGRLRVLPGPVFDGKNLSMQLGESRVAGTVRLTTKRLDAELKEIAVAASDFHRMAPLEDPPAAIRGTLSAHGPLKQIVTRMTLHPGAGTVKFDGVVDAIDRRVRAVVDHDHLDGAFFPKRPPFVISAHVQLEVAFTDQGIVGPAELTGGSGSVWNVTCKRVSANGRFTGHGVEFGRAALDIPGGTVHGRAIIPFAGRIEVDFSVDVTDSGKLLALKKGEVEIPSPPKNSALLSFDGRMVKDKGKKAVVKMKLGGVARKIARRPNATPM